MVQVTRLGNPIKRQGWMLEGIPGLRTVYFKVRDGLIEAEPVTDSITFILPPAGLSLMINSGAADTALLKVTLTISALGTAEMCFSNDGTTYTAWEAYSTTKE